MLLAIFLYMIYLMKNTFFNEPECRKKLSEFVLTAQRLSMDVKCREFEKEFAKYQGRKYAVFVNSGSSANLALIQSLLNLGLIKKGDKVGFSAVTWPTNVMPLIQLGLEAVPVDVSEKNLNVNVENLIGLKEKIKVLFVTNLLGFSGRITEVKEYCEKNKIILLEDNCESLGSKVDGKKLGNFGLASTFSFFVGHHLSTIEGGMICTDDSNLHDMLTMVRAHGWSRNIDKNAESGLREKYNVSEFYNKYTFYYPAYNFRPMEINGFLGLEQLKYMDEIHKRRAENFKKYVSAAKNNVDFHKLDFSHMEFISNFAYPVICANKEVFAKYLEKFRDVEIRPIVGGSTVEQPFFNGKKYSCPNAKKIHELGFYVPNNPDLTADEVKTICKILEG
ncbi:UDP-4-amino-4-deoxy-L-arabinose--oxoglutarate aminotransferase [uncultured archaeon]|nr:UDP-4-amino-4-deoxy-L-arabinose--oxoglutarate aminotransferase [uncultured archaeon]